MTHKKEWTTCDRCGANIKTTPSEVSVVHFIRSIICKPKELEVLTVDNKGFIGKTELISPDIVSAEIVEYYSPERKAIHLCGKCRKDFKRFMRNE